MYVGILDMDECERKPCEEACTNTVGSYICSCTGRKLSLANDKKTCFSMYCFLKYIFFIYFKLLSAAERRGTPALLSASVSDNLGNSPQMAARSSFKLVVIIDVYLSTNMADYMDVNFLAELS